MVIPLCWARGYGMFKWLRWRRETTRTDADAHRTSARRTRPRRRVEERRVRIRGRPGSTSPAIARRPGPTGPCPDGDLADHIRREIEASDFRGEGYRKI